MKFEKYLLNNVTKTELLYKIKLFFILHKIYKWIKKITMHFENSMEHKHMLTVKTHIQTVINPLSD